MAFARFCSLLDIQNIISVTGAALRLDDNPPTGADGGTALINDVIMFASDEVELYTAQRYDTSTFVGVSMVTHWTAVIATYFLSLRRGNPPSPGVAAHYERVMGELERVQRGNLKIPNAAQLKAFVPTVSNMRATNRPFPRAVVEKARSTGVPENIKQHVDPYDSFGWNNDAVLDFTI